MMSCAVLGTLISITLHERFPSAFKSGIGHDS